MKDNLGLRPQQGIFIHVLLGCTTAGIGNIFYYVSVKRKQDQWDRTIQTMNTKYNR